MEILDAVSSRDGATKYLLGLDDGLRIETVFLELNDRNKDSLCISSQVGCALGCQFCQTGLVGFKRNLTSEEIVEQVEVVLRARRFVPRRRFDLSYMGMGEPLQNFDAVTTSAELLRRSHPDFSYHLSTVGLASRIRRLADRWPNFTLQVSLHAPTDEIRSRLMPVNRAYPIATLLDAADMYATASGRAVVLNYCLMNDVNDQPEHLDELINLLRDRKFRVQLVDFNAGQFIGFAPSTNSRKLKFAEALKAAGIRTHTSANVGRYDGAGCGQLDADYALAHSQSATLRPRPRLFPVPPSPGS